jgi:hypothetical protein
LYVNGRYFCDTLEDRDRGLRASMPLERIKAVKVPGETAIPTGEYRIRMDVKSPKFSAARYGGQYDFCEGKLPRLVDVPGYEGVLIHAGNNASHTDGCILVGKNTIKGQVTSSTATLKVLWQEMMKAEKRGETITIAVI